MLQLELAVKTDHSFKVWRLGSIKEPGLRAVYKTLSKQIQTSLLYQMEKMTKILLMVSLLNIKQSYIWNL